MDTIQPEQAGFSSRRLQRIDTLMQRYVDEGKLGGILSMVARRGKIAHCATFGMQEIETGRPMQLDTLFRIYSMTKPIASTAALMLLEEGAFRLSDPVSRYLPVFNKMKVFNGPDLVDCKREISIRDLLTHTAGLSYGFDESSVLDEMYRQRVWAEMDRVQDMSLEDAIALVARLPLAFQPGSAFRYSMATDVLGYLVQVVAGMPFAKFLQERIFDPLGMVDTAFFVAPEKVQRFSATYGPADGGGLAVVDAPLTSNYLRPGRMPSGGGGLVSTAMDYMRFAQMLLNGGELEGVRLLGRKTVELMTLNHLPQGVNCFGNPHEGFGLGVSVLLDVAGGQTHGSVGNYGWSGAAGTNFWVDPREQLVGLLLLQYMPMDTHPVVADFRTAVYQALVD